jgi:hypothetical protein
MRGKAATLKNFSLDVPPAEAVAQPTETPAVAAAAHLKKPIKAKRAKPEVVEQYHKAISLQLTKAQYIEWKNCLMLEDRIGQEMAVELITKWCERVRKKSAKAQLSGAVEAHDEGDSTQD